MISPTELNWQETDEGLTGLTAHGTWCLRPAPRGCEVGYRAFGVNGPEIAELLWTASAGEAQVIVGLYEKLAGVTGTSEEIITAYRLHVTGPPQDYKKNYSYRTKQAGCFSFMQLLKEHDGWSALSYEPGRNWHNVFIARFYNTPYQRPMITHTWPKIVVDPVLTTMLIAGEMIQRRLAAGAKRYCLPIS
jgi:hypothetical protein